MSNIGRHRSPWALLLAMACLVGCNDTPEPQGIPFENVTVEFSTAVCDVLDDCLGDTLRALFFAQVGTADCDTFFARFVEETAVPMWNAALNAETATYDGVAFQNCVTAVVTTGCSIFSDRFPEECSDAFVGTVAEGDNCDSTAECELALICDNADSCPGTCVRRKTDGQSCNDDDNCRGGLQCNEGRCRRPSGVGDPCGGGTEPDCAFRLVCVGDDDETGTPGVCEAENNLVTAELDAPCNLSDGPLCTPGLSCMFDVNTEEFKCVARLSAGSPCSFSLPEACPDGEACLGLSLGGNADGTCQPMPVANEPCTVFGFCAPALRCVEDICRAVRSLGQSCSDDRECWSGKCEQEECVPPSLCL